MSPEKNFCKSYAEDYAALLKHTGKFKELRLRSGMEKKSELIRLKMTIAGIFWDMKEGLNGYMQRNRGEKMRYIRHRLKELQALKSGLLLGEEDEKYWELGDELIILGESFKKLHKEDEIAGSELKEIHKMQKENPRID